MRNLNRTLLYLFSTMLASLAVACGGRIDVSTLSPLEHDDVKAQPLVQPGMSQAAVMPRQQNPFAGAVLYINPDYAQSAAASANALPPGSADAQLATRAKQFPTAVWLDRIAALEGGAANGNRLSLTQHLDAAVAQSIAAGQPAAVTLVVYDLPNRDCAALASNGELQGASGLARYKSAYIDAIFQAVTSKPEYQKLRIVMVLEPDSLPNLITNQSVPACAEAASQNLYIDGVTYAIRTLSQATNAYIYLDIAHSGWLGWPNNMDGAIRLYSQLFNSVVTNGSLPIRGLATNTANYTPLVEPFVNPNDTSILSGPFYQWNPIFDEVTYVRTLASRFDAAGFSGLGFLIDTSRNGWPLIDDGHPIDRRKARGNWCNVRGPGLGERPTASPAIDSHLDAFMYIKPPGESDGQSGPSNPQNTPDTDGKRFDPHCDPNDMSLDAMPGAPSAGNWFNDDFMMLLHNATPALDSNNTGTGTTSGGSSTGTTTGGNATTGGHTTTGETTGTGGGTTTSGPATTTGGTATTGTTGGASTTAGGTTTGGGTNGGGPTTTTGGGGTTTTTSGGTNGGSTTTTTGGGTDGGTTGNGPQAGCHATIQPATVWTVSPGVYGAVLNVDVSNTGPTPITVPWGLEIWADGLVRLDGPWNWQVDQQSAGYASGTATQKWETLEPNGASTAQVGGIVTLSQPHLAVTRVSIAGVSCQVTASH